jgi:DNA-directed RNA polymerase II subunit RPB2
MLNCSFIYIAQLYIERILRVNDTGGNACLKLVLMNQEDSLTFNKTASDRGNFKGLAFNFTKVELEKGEIFGNPDESNTIIDRKRADRSKIKGGMISKGTIIKKNDVIIGKLSELSEPLPPPNENKKYKDTSILYSSDEPAMVEMVTRDKNQEDIEFCQVKYSCVRPVDIGNKFSSRAGQKGMTGMNYHQWDMPFTSEGIVPSLVLNPNAIPSRMTIGQIIEGLTGKVAALKGALSDATIFKKIDIDAIGDELENLGYDRYGAEHCFDGKTGEPIDQEVFIAPTYYQRLQKFAVEEKYAISTGPTDIITRQPLEGKSNRGGLRIGKHFA